MKMMRRKLGRRAWQRLWNSLVADVYRRMLGVVAFTAVMTFVVVSYAWSTFVDDVQSQSLERLMVEYGLPGGEVRDLLERARQNSERTLDVPALVPLVILGALMSLMLPSLLAWWPARRFTGPLTQLSMAAQHLRAGDLSARVPLDRALERRSDETAQLLNNFNVMAESLERLERERQYSVAAIAHELRTPVTVLRGRLEALRDGVLPATPQEVEKLIGHADLLTRLIEDLHLISLAEAGALRLEPTLLDLAEVLTRLHEDYLPRARAQGVALVLERPPDRVQFNADRRRLHQVLSNVMNNALRHTPEQGTIRIQVQAGVQAQTFTIDVHNTGAGFTPEALARGFERFYSAPDRERGRAGSGLGLAISRSLVEAHGGRIELLNTETGAGVRIVLRGHQLTPEP